MIQFFIIFFVIVFLFIIVTIWEDHSTEKDIERSKVLNEQNEVLHMYVRLKKRALSSNEILKTLKDYLTKIEKIKSDAELMKAIKPYDEFNTSYKLIFTRLSIVIDKYGEPRFKPVEFELKEDNKYRDIMISNCFDYLGLKKYIEECNAAKFNYDIETNRKAIIETKLKN